MTRISSLILFAAASLALASPALAKSASVLQGEDLCKAEVKKQSPKSVRVNKDETSTTDASFIYTLLVKAADDTKSTVRCTVDKRSSAVVLTAGK